MRAENLVLREEHAELTKRANALLDADFQVRDRMEFDRLVEQGKGVMRRIQRIEEEEETMIERRAFESRTLRTSAPPMGDPDGFGFGAEKRTSRGENKEHRQAFQGYLRGGATVLSTEQRVLLAEHRDMGTGGQGAYPGATSGFFVPVGFVNEVEDAMKYYGPMLVGGPGMPMILPTETGQLLPFPAADDTNQVGEQIAENAPVTTADVPIQQVMFGAFKYSTKMVKVSLELMQDSNFDIEKFLITEFGRRLGRIVNTKTTVGVGGGTEPLGIVPAIVAGGNIVTAVGAMSNDGASGLNTIGSDDFTNMEHAVDPVYRPGARYMMHDSTLKAVKKVKDKYGRPLWQESTRDGSPATINGYQYCINNDMDQLQEAPGSPTVVRRTVIFGDLTKHVVRRVRQLSVLRLSERFAEYGQVAFLGFGRYDSNTLDIGRRAQAILQNVY